MLVTRDEAQALSERLIKAASEECQRTGTTLTALSKMTGINAKVLYYWVNGMRIPQAFWVIVSMQDALAKLKSLPDNAKRDAVKDILQ